MDTLKNEALEKGAFRVRLFREGAPRMYKHQESGIFVVKVRSLLNGHTFSVVLNSFSGELDKL